jgi:hypothetical protein
MRTFTLFVYDDRYSVPTIDFVVAGDADRARSLAAQRLLASIHHRHVEVSDDGGVLFDVSRNGNTDRRPAL